jgi:hypothetical protein
LTLGSGVVRFAACLGGKAKKAEKVFLATGGEAQKTEEVALALLAELVRVDLSDEGGWNLALVERVERIEEALIARLVAAVAEAVGGI